jgi:predicted transcriptional regulator
METDVHWIPTDMPLEGAAQELARRRITGAPVCTPDGKVVGVLSTTDLTSFYGGANEHRRAADVMTTKVLAVGSDDSLQHAILVMAFERVHRVLVLDRAGRLLGIVTSMDVLRELVGVPRQRESATAAVNPF